MLNLLTDLPGIRVGHATDLDRITGVTCAVIERPNVAAVLVAGGAPGTRGTSILAPETVNQDVDAIVLSGGSAFGLDAAGGVMAVLAADGIGFAVGATHVPIVAQAIVFDLNSGGAPLPQERSLFWDLGRDAARTAAGGAFALGSVGGGTGATTATFKGGVGSASAKLDNGFTVSALTVVNAVGSATAGRTQHFLAGDIERDGEFGGHGPAPAGSVAGNAALPMKGAGPATTISLVATDATLTKGEARRLAMMANTGLARAIRPANAPMDGDVVFAVSRPLGPAPDPVAQTIIGQAAADCLARAIARAVYEADIPCAAYTGPPSYVSQHGRT
jgi:L-aminopeptidase/D-esterase-like protein